ncbi:SRPBCC family protein [Virgibacillus senegalensis]|uniref:SRPBCC family protein n=1 Tax=Virgibacillus senegalensis TaxID=1499679 RepID=UPI00069CC2AB|nr:SRPBCC domain-containing protein [Virgibacillus senegalensis]
MNEGYKPVIKHRTYIKTYASDIYRALTTEKGWNAWFTDETTLTFSEDGKGTLRLCWEDFGQERQCIVEHCQITAMATDKLFAFTWKPGRSETIVRLLLKPYKAGTMVELEEKGYTLSNQDLETSLYCASGWGEALTLFKIYLETGLVFKKDLL